VEQKRRVSKEEANEFAILNDMLWFESSFKNNSNVKEIFDKIAEMKMKMKMIMFCNEFIKINDDYEKNIKHIHLGTRITNMTNQKSCCR
jgi:hypothetical protein